MSYCWQELSELPSDADVTATTLDISHNHFKCLSSLEQLKKLKTLIADDNELESDFKLPNMPQLEILSLNKNKIADLERLCVELTRHAPRLEFLSLLGNPGAPDNIFNHISRLAETESGKAVPAIDIDEGDFARYRLLVAYLMPGLKYLDSSPITASERREAKLRGSYLLKVRPAADTADSVDASGANGDIGQQQYTPLPAFGAPPTDSVDRAAFGKSRYVYYGKHSEGNRFIRNNDL